MIDDVFKEKMEARRKYQPYRLGDVRSQFDRDEARLIHSAAFRRLQSKTQVLGLGESDFYRTRLTHSMEVAQIGRGIVQYLEKSGDFSEYKEYLPDMALISAICLAHDIGHPPFGHGGEVALNYCMRNHGGFEGNGQTLRILGKLDKYTEQHGLNPTRRMLLGVLKYPAAYSSLVNEDFYEADTDKNAPYWLFKAKFQKPPKCYFDTDQDIVDFIFDGFNQKDIEKFTAFTTNSCKHQSTRFKSLDCTIMNLADNISYSLHDLEDALSLGMISQSQWGEYFKEKKYLFDNLYVEVEDEFENKEYAKYLTITKNLFSSESHIRKDTIGLLVNYMITNVVIAENGSDCENKLLSLEVKLINNAEELRDLLCGIVLKFVILDENVQQLEFKGQKLIIELFQVLAKDPERFLPKSTRVIWKNSKVSLPPQEHESAQLRVICDFIAGMTDDYATKFYEKFFTPNKGSIFDRL
ncbi:MULTISPECIES: anti-phage deoxyguanosine triphosphatase [Psychrobacter]|uniref:anti-phage deoxyguanosine triphosphatase n=1 Tax=Psychrobacter TaxID=497 RepID=UPI001D007E43|nr:MULTISPECIES: anti-phage deoxyguanosine triphosphatase [Psychrobacter]